MRILHVISGIDPRNGGTTSALIGLTSAQQRAGLSVRAIATWQDPEALDSAKLLESLGIGMRMVGPAVGKLSDHPQLAGALREEIERAHIVHVHAVWEQIQHLAAGQCHAANKPFVVSPHGMLSSWSRRQKWLKKWIYLNLRLRHDLKHAAAIHFATDYERKLTAELKLTPPVIIEPLGVDLEEFQTLPEPGVFRAQFPQLQDRRIIMYLGRIDRAKGLEYLIPAMARLQARDAMLVAVGPDWRDFRPVVEKMLDEHQVRDRVLFTGMLRGRDRIEALAAADLFALPSEHENFGIVVVEALACGVPVIVSDHVALAGEVRQGQVGAVVPTGDVPALARELDHWLADEPLRRAASERARPFVREQFDWTQIGRRWVGHYERAAERFQPR